MLDILRSELEDKLSSDIGTEVVLSNKELKEALDEIGRDLIYNYFIFKKDVTYKDFIENLKLYLKLCNEKKLIL